MQTCCHWYSFWELLKAIHCRLNKHICMQLISVSMTCAFFDEPAGVDTWCAKYVQTVALYTGLIKLHEHGMCSYLR